MPEQNVLPGIAPGDVPATLPTAAVAAYLDRLGVGDPGRPSIGALRELHRRHVERVPYEVIDIQLRRPTTADPGDSVDRVLAGRGGYCVQLNGAFSQLLAALGYAVSWHRAGVHANAALPPVSAAAPCPHLVLTVELDGRPWLVDVGLGDGLHEPLPLRAGTYEQGPTRFRLAPSRVDPGGWRFDHDTRGAIAGMDLVTAAARPADFAEWHPYLSTSPESRLVRAMVVMRRDATGIDTLTGCVLRRTDRDGRTGREITDPADWFEVLHDVFGLRLHGIDAGQRSALWAQVRRAHEAWLASRVRR